MIDTLEFPLHEFAKMLPAMTAEEERELQDHIDKHGQIEPVVLHEGKILEGRHRAKVCAKLGLKLRHVEFDKLPESVREAGPLQFVIAKNLKRRHLTTSQKAAIAAELEPLFAKEAKERESARKKGLASNEASQRNGEVVRGKSAERAAAVMGVSRASVERAKKLKAEAPEKFEALKAGKKQKPGTDVAAAQKQAALEAAYERIEKVCGKEFGQAVRDGIRLRKPKDVIGFADQLDSEMKEQQGLIAMLWPLKKAQLFRAKNLTKRHTIQDLLNKAASEGFSLSIDIDGWRIDVERTKSSLTKVEDET